MRFSILGGQGFIGRHLARYLENQGHEVWVPERGAPIEAGTPAGHVVYAIGLTGDFRRRLYETIEAHVTILTDVIRAVSFDSFLYLSSTRVYSGLPVDTLASEDTRLSIVPSADSLYDISKLLGEAVCLAQPQETVRVARLSNVYGAGQSIDTFLGAVMKDARESRRVTIREACESSKDYVSVDSVVEALEKIALTGNERLYNLAAGVPTTHEALGNAIGQLTGAEVHFAPDAPLRVFPRIDISRAQKEFGFNPRPVIEDLEHHFDGQADNLWGTS